MAQALYAAFSRSSVVGPVPSRPAGTRPEDMPASGRRDSGRTAPGPRVAHTPEAADSPEAGRTPEAAHSPEAGHNPEAVHNRVAGHNRVVGQNLEAGHIRLAAHSQGPDTPEAVDLGRGDRWGCTNRRPARSTALGWARAAPAGQSSTQLTAAQRQSTGAAIARGPEVPGIHTTAETRYVRRRPPGWARMLYVA